jgi:hypothetical protein
MKKGNKNETENAEALKKKLEKIIEQSKSENEALKKILSGLEKMKDKQTENKNKKINK